MANALILHGLFCRIPYAVLQGILEPNLIPSREFESRSREFGALPGNPNPARLLWAPNGDKRHADLRPDFDHEPAGFTRSSVRFPCQRRGVQSSKPAKPMIKPMILCAPCDKIQSGDGCVANIGGFPAESSWRAIRATSRPNSTGSFAW